MLTPPTPSRPADSNLAATQSRLRLLALVLLLLPIGTLLVIRVPGFGNDAGGASLPLNYLQNLGHFGAFALLSGLCFALFTRSPKQLRQRFAMLTTALVAMAVGSEIMQLFLPRTASVQDVIIDLYGVVCGAVAVVAWRVRAAERDTGWKSVHTLLLIFLLVLCLPLVWLLHQQQHINERLPLLTAFSTPLDALQWRADPSLKIADAAYLTFSPERRQGFEYRNFVADWRSYQTLVVEVDNTATEELQFAVRIDDQSYRSGPPSYFNRFQKTFKLAPGKHSLRIPVSDIRDGPKRRELNVGEVFRIIFYSRKLQGAEVVVAITSIRLE